MIGARFRPGGAYAILSRPVSELNDQVVELELLFGSSVHELRERLLAAPSVDRRFAVLDAALVRRACNRMDLDPALARALELLAAVWVALGIATIALFERRSWSYILINAGYWIVSFVVMGTIIGAWR